LEIFDLVTSSILDAIEAEVKVRQARWLPGAQVDGGPGATRVVDENPPRQQG